MLSRAHAHNPTDEHTYPKEQIVMTWSIELDGGNEKENGYKLVAAYRVKV